MTRKAAARPATSPGYEFIFMDAYVSSVQNIRFAVPGVETFDLEVGNHRNCPAGVTMPLRACTRTDSWNAIALRTVAMGLCLMSFYRLVRIEQAIVSDEIDWRR
jgi:hypothetical protein